MPEQELSLIGKHDATCVEITSGLRRFEDDGPHFDERLTDLASKDHHEL